MATAPDTASYAPTLADVIGLVESNHNVSEIRFEDEIFCNKNFSASLISVVKKANTCNALTARMLLSCSFGEYQIMGFNLYGGGYRKSIVQFLVSSLDQLNALDSFLKSSGIAPLSGANYSPRELLDADKRRAFALRYNGPGNVDNYSARVFSALQTLGVK